MTDAERQARYRAARAAGVPVIRIRRPADRRSRIQRWYDTIAALVDAAGRIRRLAGRACRTTCRTARSAEALQAIVDLDLVRAAGDRTAARLRP